MIKAHRKNLWPFLIAVNVLALCIPSSSAYGQDPIAISIETSRGQSPQDVEYRLQVVSGVAGAQFGLEYGLPAWPTDEPVFGSPVKVPSIGLSGSGSIEPAPGLTPKPVLQKKHGCIRAIPDRFSQRYWVEIPPNSASTVSLLVKGTYPSWPRTTYGVAFSTFSTNDPLAELVPLASIDVPRLMSRGTHIEVRAKGRSGADRTPEIVGRTSPPFRSGLIFVRAVRPSRSGRVGLEDWLAASAVPLGVVQTDRQGRFVVPPRAFTGKGSYAVIARSGARGSRAADWNCGAFFSIG